jgi:3-oxoacyl-[acyl-carrier-protein] synthase II
VDYINAHGTATLAGDRIEVLAIRKLFGEHADRLAVTSTKSMVGHLLGAAGGLETIVTALSVLHDVVTPTINLDTPDPECDLDFVPHTKREMTVRAAMTNSFGFGGTNATLLLRKCEA